MARTPKSKEVEVKSKKVEGVFSNPPIYSPDAWQPVTKREVDSLQAGSIPVTASSKTAVLQDEKLTPSVDYQWLRIPLGTFDFISPEKLFRDEQAPTNKALIGSYRKLLDSGFEIKLFEIHTEYKYILFEKRNG